MAVLAVAGKALVKALKFAFLPGFVPGVRSMHRDIVASAERVNKVVPRKGNGRLSVLTRTVFAMALGGIVIMAASQMLMPAVAQGTDMESLFTIPSQNEATDIGFKSVKALFDTEYTDNTRTIALRDAFVQVLGLFNTAVLAIAGLILLYHILAIVAETAKTGKPFGNRFNEVWAPIRLIVAIGLLVPLPMSGSSGGGNVAGYSAGQHIVLTVANLSGGLASNLWSGFSRALTQNADVTVRRAPSDTYPVAYGLMRGFTCMHAINQQLRMSQPSAAGNIWDGPRVDLRMTNDGSGVHRLLFGSSQFPALCGGIEVATMQGYSGEEAARRAVAVAYTKHLFADGNGDGTMGNGGYDILNFSGLVSWWGSSAHNGGIVNYVWEGSPRLANYGEQMWNLSKKISTFVVEQHQADPTNAPTPAEVVNLVNSFDTAVSSEINEALNTYREVASVQLQQEVDALGWMGAPMWYMTLARVNAAVSTLAESRPYPIAVSSLTPCPSNASAGVSCDPGINGEVFRAGQNALTYFDAYWAGAMTTAGNASAATQPTGGSGPRLTREEQCQATQENAVRGAAAAGSVTPETNLPREVFNYVTNAMFSVLSSMVVGSKDVCELMVNEANPIGSLTAFGNRMIDKAFQAILVELGIKAVFGADIAILTALAALIITAGIVLAYVLPLMPFVRFMFGIVGWLVSLFSAIVAVPLWAVAHLRIDGDGLPGPAAANGYLMMLSLLLRPTLMIMGLIAAMLSFIVLIGFLNDGFFNLMYAMHGTGQSSVLQRVMYMVTYCAMAFALANVTFKMIDVVPAEAMKWINAPIGPDFDENMTPAIVAAGTASFRATDGLRKATPAGGATRLAGSAMGGLKGLSNRLGARGQGTITKAE